MQGPACLSNKRKKDCKRCKQIQTIDRKIKISTWLSFGFPHFELFCHLSVHGCTVLHPTRVCPAHLINGAAPALPVDSSNIYTEILWSDDDDDAGGGGGDGDGDDKHKHER